MIREIQSPPIERVGVMDLESFFPSRDRLALAMTLNNLLPERFDTDRQKHMARLMMERQGLTLEEARTAITNTIKSADLSN